jgi:hypothetical protein
MALTFIPLLSKRHFAHAFTSKNNYYKPILRWFNVHPEKDYYTVLLATWSIYSGIDNSGFALDFR